MKKPEWLRRLPMDLLMDIVGGLIYAVGLNCFANPNDIAPRRDVRCGGHPQLPV